MRHRKVELKETKVVTIEEVKNEQNSASECFSTRTTMLEPNSITQIDFVTKLDREEGEIRGNKELEKQGIVVLNNSIIDNEKYLWIQNNSDKRVLLKKEVAIATMQDVTQRIATVHTVYYPDSSDEEEGKEEPLQFRRSMEQEMEKSPEIETDLEEQLDNQRLEQRIHKKQTKPQETY